MIPLRSIRIPDDLWTAAAVRAAERGESVSEAVRKFLVRYTKERK
jgi:plasmid stability protein